MLSCPQNMKQLAGKGGVRGISIEFLFVRVLEKMVLKLQE